jgi:hypothetical protein
MNFISADAVVRAASRDENPEKSPRKSPSCLIGRQAFGSATFHYEIYDMI